MANFLRPHIRPPPAHSYWLVRSVPFSISMGRDRVSSLYVTPIRGRLYPAIYLYIDIGTSIRAVKLRARDSIMSVVLCSYSISCAALASHSCGRYVVFKKRGGPHDSRRSSYIKFSRHTSNSNPLEPPRIARLPP